MFKKSKKSARGGNERKTWIKKLDTVFSLYIRMRDSRMFGYRSFRCISCGDVKPFNMMDCGHYISRNNFLLRWNELNAHGECSNCNRFIGSHLVGYRENLIIKLGEDAIRDNIFANSLEPKKRLELIKRKGEERVKDIEAQRYKSKKWSVEELKEEYMYYAALVLKMKNE